MLGILTHRWEHETGLSLLEILENSICIYVCMTRFYVFFYTMKIRTLKKYVGRSSLTLAIFHSKANIKS